MSTTPYNWADDINTVTNDIKALHRLIHEQKEMSKMLKLPFSAEKTQLLAIYPKGWKYAKIKPGDVVAGIRVSSKLKILGLTWQQPTFRKSGGTDIHWFSSQAQQTIKKLQKISLKSKRLKWHQHKLTPAAQRLLMNTYACSRVQYSAPIWLSHTSPSNLKDIETKMRGIARNIYNVQQ